MCGLLLCLVQLGHHVCEPCLDLVGFEVRMHMSCVLVWFGLGLTCAWPASWFLFCWDGSCQSRADAATCVLSACVSSRSFMMLNISTRKKCPE